MARALPLQNYTRLSLVDRDESQARTADLWEPHKGTLLGGKFYLRWNQFDLVRAAIGAFEFHSNSLIEAEPQAPIYRVCCQIDGAIQHKVAGVDAVSSSANAVVHPPRADLTLRLHPQKALFAGFEEKAVRAAIRSRLGEKCAALGPAPAFATDRGPGQVFRSFLFWLANEIDTRDSGLIKSPKSLAAIDRTLLELFADALVDSGADTVPDRLSEIGEFRLRQVEEWIEANLGEAFGVTELAAVAGADVRSVREAFRAFRDTSPTDYVINARLDRARKMLLRAPAGTTITSVCISCGMFHFGRFSMRYKARFGETPTQTLARGADA